MMTMTVQELKQRLDQQEDLQLVDVRQEEEWNICRVANAKLIPLSEFAARGPEEIDPEKPTALMCHHGMRSAQAQSFLISRGFDKVYNVVGGIDAWAAEVEPGMSRY